MTLVFAVTWLFLDFIRPLPLTFILSVGWAQYEWIKLNKVLNCSCLSCWDHLCCPVSLCHSLFFTSLYSPSPSLFFLSGFLIWSDLSFFFVLLPGLCVEKYSMFATCLYYNTCMLISHIIIFNTVFWFNLLQVYPGRRIYQQLFFWHFFYLSKVHRDKL